MIGVVLMIQSLPKMLRRGLRAEEQRWLKEQQAEQPALLAKKFVISNSKCSGKRLLP